MLPSHLIKYVLCVILMISSVLSIIGVKTINNINKTKLKLLKIINPLDKDKFLYKTIFALFPRGTPLGKKKRSVETVDEEDCGIFFDCKLSRNQHNMRYFSEEDILDKSFEDLHLSSAIYR